MFLSKQNKIENPDVFRSNIVKKLSDKLKNDKHALNLEKGIFNYALKESEQKKVLKKWDNRNFILIYLDKLRSVYTNLNQGIIEEITNETLKPHKVAFMTHQELSPDKWKSFIDAKIKRDKYKFETNVEAATDTFTCRKCRINKCTYYQMQTRSADEPMTTFVTCINCGNRWKC